MASDTRTYIKLADGLPEHPKVIAVGGDAAWLHVCAIAYCSRNMSDGVFPKAVIPRLSDRKSPQKLGQALVKEGLWHEDGHDCTKCEQPGKDSVILHDYLEHQRSREHIEAVRAKRAAAGSKGGRPKASGKQNASGLVTKGLSHGESKGESPRNPVSVSEGLLRNPQTEEPLRGSQTEIPPPESAGTVVPRIGDVAEPSPQTLLAEWIDACPKRPVQRVIARVGREVKSLLEEGVPYDEVRDGLIAWHEKRLDPATIPSVVNEVRMGPRKPTPNNRQAQTDDLFAAAMQRAAEKERNAS